MKCQTCKKSFQAKRSDAKFCSGKCRQIACRERRLGIQEEKNYPSRLYLEPVSFDEACQFIEMHHRHHLKPQGWKFGIGCSDGSKLVGVVIVGRPVSRNLNVKEVAEVTRCCTDGSKHACSMLYSAAWRAAKALGFKKLITYTLISESGTSLKAANWQRVRKIRGRSWHRAARPRIDKHPIVDRILWQKT